MSTQGSVDWSLNGYFLISIGFGAFIALFFIYYSLSITDKKPEPEQEDDEKKKKQNVKQEQPKKEKKEKEQSKKKESVQEQVHPLRLNVLKGHTNEINAVCYSPDGKFIVSVSDDKSLRGVWVETLQEKIPKCTRLNLADQVSGAGFSTDGSCLVFGMSYSRELAGYRFGIVEGKLSLQEIFKFSTPHKDTIKSVCPSQNAKIILTCGENTTLFLHTSKGNLLTSINTGQMRNNMAVMSPDGRLFAVAAWTGEVKVWHIQLNKSTQEFEKVSKAMDLGEHRSTVYWVSFSADSSRVVTTSKDGTMKLWKVDVRFDIGEDPKCILTIKCPVEKKGFSIAVISPDGKLIAATLESDIYFYSIDGKLLDKIENAHDTIINSLVFAPNSTHFVTTATNDYSLKVWKNPAKK